MPDFNASIVNNNAVVTIDDKQVIVVNGDHEDSLSDSDKILLAQKRLNRHLADFELAFWKTTEQDRVRQIMLSFLYLHGEKNMMVTNLGETVYRSYLGKHDSDEDFMNHLLEDSGKSWMSEYLDLSKSNGTGWKSHRGHYFKTRKY